MEDKQAIEAIANIISPTIKNYVLGYIHNLSQLDVEVKRNSDFITTSILQTLTSLGYVKLAEQKLPPYEGSYDDLKECYEEAQQDMLSVDSEGCAYRRVKVNG